MKRTILISILTALFAVSTAVGCSDNKKAETTEPEKTETESGEGEDEAGDDGEKDEGEDAKEDEKADEKADDAKADDKKEDDKKEEAKAEAEPGTIPFEYPVVATTAAVGDFVLAPPRDWIDKGFAKGGDKQTFIFYSATVIEPGEKDTKLKKIGKEESIPNSMIIPIPKGAKAKKGDVLLTWWQSGSGMKRAVVVGGSETEPKVRYLDVDLDNPSGLGTKEDTLKPDSFTVLTADWAPGTAVAIKSGSSWKHGQIVNMAGDKVLTVGFAGRMAVSNKADVVALPVKPNVKKGDKVWVPFVGTFREATVEKVNAKIGRVFTKFKFANKDKELAVAFGNVAASLEGGTAAPVAEAKPDDKKGSDDDIKKGLTNYDGAYTGRATGTQGITGQVQLVVKGAKVTGNLKGTRTGGEKWNTGFSGTMKGTRITGSGSNKNTKLTIQASASTGVIRGQGKGDINGKKGSITFTANKK